MLFSGEEHRGTDGEFLFSLAERILQILSVFNIQEVLLGSHKVTCVLSFIGHSQLLVMRGCVALMYLNALPVQKTAVQYSTAIHLLLGQIPFETSTVPGVPITFIAQRAPEN